MAESLVVYTGLILAFVGFVLSIVRLFRRASPLRALTLAAAGLLVLLVGLALPARESHVAHAKGPVTRLDEITPHWQFAESHSIRIAAPPERVYAAMREVRAGEIALFRTLTWIRRGGRSLPPATAEAARRQSLVDTMLHSGFVVLAEEPPREFVFGAVVLAPRSVRRIARDVFTTPPPGFAVATANFVVTSDGAAGSNVRTETRVFASDTSTRRRFAAYWRLIYPGSALIRRGWLRAIERRAMEGRS